MYTQYLEPTASCKGHGEITAPSQAPTTEKFPRFLTESTKAHPGARCGVGIEGHDDKQSCNFFTPILHSVTADGSQVNKRGHKLHKSRTSYYHLSWREMRSERLIGMQSATPGEITASNHIRAFKPPESDIHLGLRVYHHGLSYGRWSWCAWCACHHLAGHY